MKPFLQEVAEDLFRSHGNRLEDICLVFPNRRAGLFFNKYLAGLLQQPVWSPSIYTIQDLMSRISDLNYADELEQISLLYKIYARIRGSGESFDEFFFWGEVMLGDFDEVDKYLVDAKDLFRNLADLKDLERSFQYLSSDQVELIQRFWSTFSMEQLSQQKQQFLEIWSVLYPVYEGFRNELLGRGLGYEGMVYRDVAEKIGSGRFPDLPFNKIVFTGFNALNPCEQILFKDLQNTGKAVFYWDYDEYYLDREVHEAGRFMRENLSAFKDSGSKIERLNIRKSRKTVQVYSIPSDAGQAQLVHSILENVLKEDKIAEETAIVLANEDLLIPVLNALPAELGEINVTMGHPVHSTPVFSLIEHLIDLQRNLREASSGEPRFYYRDVLPILQHQYINLRSRIEAEEMVRAIHERNLIYLPRSILNRNDLFATLFRKIERPEDIAAYLLTILEMITGGKQEDQKPVPALELEFIYRIYTRIKRLNDVLGRLELRFGLPAFLRLFHKFLQRTRIPFSGEPLAGIQVMGVLETRVLDFKRIIILSMNEGSFPGTQGIQSFIPHNLRHGFKLPVAEHQDAIYGYYFYRLIQRSEDIHLIYNSQAEGLNTGEKSRYIYQLKYDPAFDVTEWSAGFDVQSAPVQPIRVEKSEAVMKMLHGYSPPQGGKLYLSPSALNSYIDCSLQFYFKYVAGIKEPEELQEEVDPALFGTLLHESVRKLYDSLGSPIEKKQLEKIHASPDKIGEAIDDAFREVYFRNEQKRPEGRNRVIREIILSYVSRVLEKDMEYCPIRVHSLEDMYQMELRVPSGHGEISATLGGKIDRIDRLEDGCRVLDYKTGTGRMFFGSVEELFDPGQRDRNRAAFQTILYAKLFKSSGGDEGLRITPGVYLIREIFKPGFRYHFGIGTAKNSLPLWDYSGVDEEFTRNLNGLVTDIFDPDSAFVQTDQEDICRNCPYRGLCHR